MQAGRGIRASTQGHLSALEPQPERAPNQHLAGLYRLAQPTACILRSIFGGTLNGDIDRTSVCDPSK